MLHTFHGAQAPNLVYTDIPQPAQYTGLIMNVITFTQKSIKKSPWSHHGAKSPPLQQKGFPKFWTIVIGS